MDFDVCIVGAGPAGLSAAIKLKQVAPTIKRKLRLLYLHALGSASSLTLQECQAKDKDLSVCVVEKGTEVGE